jgi:hypothetical protein
VLSAHAAGEAVPPLGVEGVHVGDAPRRGRAAPVTPTPTQEHHVPLPETFTALFGGKAAAAVAGLTIAAGAAGAAGDLPAPFTVVEDDTETVAVDETAETDLAATADAEIEADETADLADVEDVEDADDDTAARVHAALVGDDVDLAPGDEGFGAAVAENARTDDEFGQDVAAAARGDEDGEESTLEETTSDEDEGRPEDAGPPAARPTR